MAAHQPDRYRSVSATPEACADIAQPAAYGLSGPQTGMIAQERRMTEPGHIQEGGKVAGKCRGSENATHCRFGPVRCRQPWHRPGAGRSVICVCGSATGRVRTPHHVHARRYIGAHAKSQEEEVCYRRSWPAVGVCLFSVSARSLQDASLLARTTAVSLPSTCQAGKPPNTIAPLSH